MTHGPERAIYHLPDGPILSETDFQPIRCGGGIAFPSWPEKVEYGMICPDCKKARSANNDTP